MVAAHPVHACARGGRGGAQERSRHARRVRVGAEARAGDELAQGERATGDALPAAKSAGVVTCVATMRSASPGAKRSS
jgi:hypothetical protein